MSRHVGPGTRSVSAALRLHLPAAFKFRVGRSRLYCHSQGRAADGRRCPQYHGTRCRLCCACACLRYLPMSLAEPCQPPAHSQCRDTVRGVDCAALAAPRASCRDTLGGRSRGLVSGGRGCGQRQVSTVLRRRCLRLPSTVTRRGCASDRAAVQGRKESRCPGGTSLR